ncbi:3-hydroxybutyryl-CoA dehydrogenase [Alphaproteobacteria bacterium 46_93_T64]|nr:3-hydroxybutyryl-CoA dehydrogenase [Alphaproteobacteria bacterium 46_93_T64]
MIKKIGIIGAGQMGNGIAHVMAVAGYEVFLRDVSQEQLDRAVTVIEDNLHRQVGRGKMEASEVPGAMARISPVMGDDYLADVDLVIEAATENEEIKKAILAPLGPQLKPEAIIATNTSSISVTRLAAVTDRPGQFMGMHFMNPVPMMKLVELIRGIATNEETFQAVKELTLVLGKTPTPAEDFPAFIVNRILLPMINEAIYTLYEGVGTVQAIDSGMRLGANHPMGPLQLADFIGLDVCLSIMQVLYEGLADTKYRPCPLLVKYVEAGWLGRKTNRGFYDYTTEIPTPTR